MRASRMTRRDHPTRFTRSRMRRAERSLASAQRSVRESSGEFRRCDRHGCDGCRLRSPHGRRARLSASRGNRAPDTATRQRSKFLAWHGPSRMTVPQVRNVKEKSYRGIRKLSGYKRHDPAFQPGRTQDARGLESPSERLGCGCPQSCKPPKGNGQSIGGVGGMVKCFRHKA